MTPGRFSNRKYVVFGAATGIGAAAATLIAREGGSLIVHYRTREAEANALCGQLRAQGASATAVQADLTDPRAVGALFDVAGDVDGFVHSVSAPLVIGPIATTDWPTFQAQWEASVKSAVLIVQALLAREVRPRAGVFVSSTVTFGAPPKDWSSYVSAKYALLGFVRSVAQEVAGQGLRLNLVSPGLTETPLTEHIDPRRREMAGRATPLKRLGTVEDAAESIAFLLSDASAYVVGADLPVAGGAVL